MTVYSVRRRRRVSLGAVLALLLAAMVFAATGQLLNAKPSILSDEAPTHVSPVGWPQSVQAASVIGNGPLAASPDESVAPAIRVRTIAAPAAAGGPGGDAGRPAQPLPPAPGHHLARP